MDKVVNEVYLGHITISTTMKISAAYTYTCTLQSPTIIYSMVLSCPHRLPYRMNLDSDKAESALCALFRTQESQERRTSTVLE